MIKTTEYGDVELSEARPLGKATKLYYARVPMAHPPFEFGAWVEELDLDAPFGGHVDDLSQGGVDAATRLGRTHRTVTFWAYTD